MRVVVTLLVDLSIKNMWHIVWLYDVFFVSLQK